MWSLLLADTHARAPTHSGQLAPSFSGFLPGSKTASEVARAFIEPRFNALSAFLLQAGGALRVRSGNHPADAQPSPVEERNPYPAGTPSPRKSSVCYTPPYKKRLGELRLREVHLGVRLHELLEDVLLALLVGRRLAHGLLALVVHHLLDGHARLAI